MFTIKTVQLNIPEEKRVVYVQNLNQEEVMWKDNDDFIVFYFRLIRIFTKCNKGKILKNEI